MFLAILLFSAILSCSATSFVETPTANLTVDSDFCPCGPLYDLFTNKSLTLLSKINSTRNWVIANQVAINNYTYHLSNVTFSNDTSTNFTFPDDMSMNSTADNSTMSSNLTLDLVTYQNELNEMETILYELANIKFITAAVLVSGASTNGLYWMTILIPTTFVMSFI